MPYPSLTTYPSLGLLPGVGTQQAFSATQATTKSQYPVGTKLFRKTYQLGDIPFNQVDAFGVEWYWSELQGWGTPPLVGDPVQRAGDEGGYMPGRVHGPRRMALTGTIAAGNEVDRDDAFNRLVASVPIDHDVLLMVNEQVPLLTLVRRDTGQIQRKNVNATTTQFQVPLIALDPRKYAQALFRGFAALTSSSGIIPPLTPPILIGGGRGTTLTLTNPGTMATRPVYTIQGGVNVPTIRNMTTGERLRWNLLLGQGQTLVVDSDAKTALINGDTTGYVPPAYGSAWFEVPAGGAVNIRLEGDAGLGTPGVWADVRAAYE